MEEVAQEPPSPRASSLPLMLGVRKWRSSASVLDESAKKLAATSPSSAVVKSAEDELEPTPLENGKCVQKLAERNENVAGNIKSDAGVNGVCHDKGLADRGTETKGKRAKKTKKPKMKKDLEWVLEKSLVDRAEKKGVVFIKMRGFPLWPAQKIPERKTRSDNVPKRPSEKCSLYQFFGTHDWAWIKDGGYETSSPATAPSAPAAGCPEEAKENLSPELIQGQACWNEQAKNKDKAAKNGLPVLQWQEGVAILESGGVSLVNKKLLEGIQEVHDLLIYNRIPEIWWKVSTIPWIGDGPPPKPYTTVRRNVYVSATKPRRPDKGDDEACVCKPSEDSCGSRCINRASFILCDPRTCPCGKECTNLPFNARKSPPLEVFFTGTRGYGVRARKPIKEDTFVVEYTGDVINDVDCEKRLRRAKRDREHNFYFMQLDFNTVIDARYRGSVGRFLNSSCRPNCETQKWRDSATNEIRVGIFTTRDIEKGEELTYNYNFQHFGNSRSKSFHCLCGTNGCIGSLDAKKAKRRKTK